jgi:hypothetical protein
LHHDQIVMLMVVIFRVFGCLCFRVGVRLGFSEGNINVQRF